MYHKSNSNTTLVNYNKDGYAENFQDVEILVKTEKRHFKKGEFLTMKKDFLSYLILETEYNLLDIKVIAYMLKNLDFNNRIKSFKQTDLANEIKSSQSRVSKTLKKLRSDHIIYKDGLDYYFSDKYIKYAGNKKTSQ